MKRVFQLLIMFIAVNLTGQQSENNKEEQVKVLIADAFQDIFSNMEPEPLLSYCSQDFSLLEMGKYGI